MHMVGGSGGSSPATHSKSGMATLMELDETLCRSPVCQHPQCWVTIRRIKQGHPRYRPLGSVTRIPPMDPVGLPMLSVTTLPINQTLPNGPDVQCTSSLATFSTMSSPSKHKLYNSTTCSMDKILFPGMNSYSEIPATPRIMASFLSTKKPWKVATVDPRIQSPATKHTTMIWVPNSQQKSQEQEKREKPLKVQVKELKFTDVCGQLRMENLDSDAPKFRKTSKPPTGGRPQNLILANSSIPMHTRKWMAASSLKENPEEIMRIKRRSNEQHSYSGSQPDPGLDSLVPENRRVVLHDTRSKHRSSPSIASHSGPLYKLDEQNLEDYEGIDLNRIRNQYYLWKKYIGLAGPIYRIQPPGSVVCDTERSNDLDSRDSPSSAGFSQTSWADVEPCDAPADMDHGKISEEDLPGEQAEEAGTNQLQEDANIPQEIPDLKSEHPLEEEKSLKEYELLDKSVRNNQGSEMSDGYGSSKQTALSPQPNPPPPSPTHESIN